MVQPSLAHPIEGPSTGPEEPPLPTFSPTHEGDPSRLDTEPNLNSVMDMLVDISSCLSANEHFVEQIRADKVTEEAQRIQSLSLSIGTPGTSKGCTHRGQALAEPWQAVLEAMADISDAVKAKVTSKDEESPIPGLAYFQ